MSWQRRSATAAPSDTGLSLVEVMVAMGLFLLGSLSLLSVLVSSMSGTFDNRARLTATNLAAADLDAARSLGYFDLATVLPRQETVDGRVYTVTREVQTTMASGTGNACDGSGSARQLYKRVSTQVVTAFQGVTTRPVRADTLVRAPLYDPSSALGAIGFRVDDRNGKPIKDLQVTASTLTRTTDATGCAFFDGLTPGPVDVTVNSPGAVTRTGSTTLRKSVKVVKGQITTDGLRIHSMVTMNVRTQVYNGNAVSPGFEAPTGAVVTLAASDRGTVTRETYGSKPLPPGGTASWPAFPSRGGYDAWLGECSPVAHGDSEPSPPPEAILLPLSPVTVTLTASIGNDNHKARGRTVSIALQPTSCAEHYTYTTTTGSGCDATSVGNTCFVKIAVPAGTWTFTVTGQTPVQAVVAARTPRNVTIPIT